VLVVLLQLNGRSITLSLRLSQFLTAAAKSSTKHKAKTRRFGNKW